jgi:hypothetical protein
MRLYIFFLTGISGGFVIVPIGCLSPEGLGYEPGGNRWVLKIYRIHFMHDTKEKKNALNYHSPSIPVKQTSHTLKDCTHF